MQLTDNHFPSDWFYPFPQSLKIRVFPDNMHFVFFCLYYNIIKFYFLKNKKLHNLLLTTLLLLEKQIQAFSDSNEKKKLRYGIVNDREQKATDY